MRSHGGGKTSGSSWGVWGRRNCPYDAPESGVLSPLRCCRTVIFQKPTAERGGWGHQGTLRAKSGGEPPGAARRAEGNTVPPSAHPTGPHPEEPGEDAADRYLSVRGQGGPRRR